jgi:choline dehydrogenase-like flavoprotein
VFVDLLNDRVGATMRTDVAIVGSGPAGLSLARRLEAHGHDVLLIESGSMSYSDAAQDLNNGEDAAGRDHYARGTRIRAFGGTTFHWAGWCAALDPTDFEQRSWIAHSGWPISAADLAPYYAEATEICDLDGRHFVADKWAAQREQPVLRWKDEEFATSYFQLSPPTRFGPKYRDAIRASTRITALLNATVTGVHLEPNGRSCKGLAVRGPDGNLFQVQAHKYAVACGGIENARLLLISNDVHRNGVGNASDLVGRFFMDHPAFRSGAMLPTDPKLNVDLYIYDSHSKLRGFGTITPTRALMKKLGSVHFNIELMPQFEGLGNSSNAFKQDYWTLAQRAKRGELIDKFGSNVATFFSMLGNGASHTWSKLLNRDRRLAHVYLRHHLESSPNPDSRVTLSKDKKDRFGHPVPRLDWRINRSDFDGWLRCQQALALAFGKSDLGRMRLDFDSSKPIEALDIEPPWHHVGTTRMHSDPKHGVVDPNCRVHGVSNLYIVGNSVFPTSGHANPTLTTVALALRLGDHLARKE